MLHELKVEHSYQDHALLSALLSSTTQRSKLPECSSVFWEPEHSLPSLHQKERPGYPHNNSRLVSPSTVSSSPMLPLPFIATQSRLHPPPHLPSLPLHSHHLPVLLRPVQVRTYTIDSMPLSSLSSSVLHCACVLDHDPLHTQAH